MRAELRLGITDTSFRFSLAIRMDSVGTPAVLELTGCDLKFLVKPE